MKGQAGGFMGKMLKKQRFKLRKSNKMTFMFKT